MSAIEAAVALPTNAEFLNLIAGTLTSNEHLWVTSFASSPNSAGARWGGRSHLPGSHLDLLPTSNNYFCVAALTGDRGAANFSRLLVLVADDCDVTALKAEPSYILQTSPGKFQVGYILKDSAETRDAPRCKRAVKAMQDAGYIAKDKAGNNIVRYVRLPVGTNTKYDPHCPHTLPSWEPFNIYSLDEALAAFGVSLQTTSEAANAESISTPTDSAFSLERAFTIMATGDEGLHDASRDAAASLIAKGMRSDDVKAILRGVMQAGSDGSERSQARIADIDRLADSAQKFAVQTQTVDPGKFSVLTAFELFARPQLDWLIKNVIPRAEIVVIFGESGSGKTFFATDLSFALSSGTAWRGIRTKKSRVVYVPAEGVIGFRSRLIANTKHNGGEIPDIKVIVDAPNLLADDDLQIATKIEVAGGADVIFIDTLAASTPGANENSGEDMGLVLSHVKRLSAATGAVVVLIHHSGKDSSKGARGWSGIRAAVDAEIEVVRMGDTRLASVTKLKDGEDGARFAFRLEQVVIGEDEDGEQITSCVVVHTDLLTTAKPKEPKGKVQRLVWKAAIDLAALNDSLSVEKLLAESVEKIVRDPDGRDTRRQRAARALQALADEGFLTIEGDLCTLS